MKKILWSISLRNILNIIFSYILSLSFYLNIGVLEHKEGMSGTNIKLKNVLISKDILLTLNILIVDMIIYPDEKLWVLV